MGRWSGIWLAKLGQQLRKPKVQLQEPWAILDTRCIYGNCRLAVRGTEFAWCMLFLSRMFIRMLFLHQNCRELLCMYKVYSVCSSICLCSERSWQQHRLFRFDIQRQFVGKK